VKAISRRGRRRLIDFVSKWSVDLANPSEGVSEQEFHADPPPPDRLGLVVGDLAHNLRSALDVAAWELAVDHDEPAALDRFWRVQFPLSSDRAEFRKHKALPFFSERVHSALEAHQPYKAGNVALGWLQSLSNADKHQVTAFSFAAMAEIPGDQTAVRGFLHQLRVGSAFGHVGIIEIRTMAATVAAVIHDLEDTFGEPKSDPLLDV
jgi:hypothetical protein